MMSPDEMKREEDLIEVLNRLSDWSDAYIADGGSEEDVYQLRRDLYGAIEKYYDEGYDYVEGGSFMDGLESSSHKRLYRFTVGFFGGHDFLWKIK